MLEVMSQGLLPKSPHHKNEGQKVVDREDQSMNDDDGDRLARSIADSKARQLEIEDRAHAGRARKGDEARLRMQKQIEASFQKRLDRVVLPSDIGSKAEDWLRNQRGN